MDSAARRAERMARLDRELRRMTVLHRQAVARRRGRRRLEVRDPDGGHLSTR